MQKEKQNTGERVNKLKNMNCSKNRKSVDQKEWKNRKQKAQYCSVVINQNTIPST